MHDAGLNKNVNYPSLEDVLTFLGEVSEYFTELKNKLKGLTEHDATEVKKKIKLVTKAESIIYQEIDIMRSSVLSKRDLAKATGTPYATFFRSLKKRNFTVEKLRIICMLLIDPTLKDEFIFIEHIRKIIENKPKDSQDLLWTYFHSIYLDRENSPFYNIDLTNVDQVMTACRIQHARYNEALAKVKTTR